jgi:molecular chaperone DnaK
LSDPIVGIDLGTSNSVVAHADDAGVVKVLADDSGYKIHPSVVSFHPNGGVVVGAGAKQRKVIDPQNTIYSVKRLIGRGYRSPEVQTAKGRVPYQIKEGANQLPMIVTRGGEFAVPEISAIVLDHMRNIAAARLGAPVSRAVVTVPASFNDAQRSATATAGAIAGLTIVRVLNEPTAAALAYGNMRNLREIIAVYDFGGGTFDITILKLHDQVYEVLGTAGDTFLGGDDLDERLVDKMVAKFLAENRIDLRSNEVSMMRLRAVAEQTKIELSRRSRAVVRIDEIAYGAKGVPLNLQIEITRDEFVSQVSDIIDRTFPVCQEALSLAGLTIGQIADTILVGGTTKIPYVRDQVSKFFAKAPRTDVNPEDAVAVGAALQATSLERILSRPRTSTRIPVQKIPEPPPIPAPAPAPSAGDSIESVDSYTDALPLNLAEVDEESGSVTMAPSELESSRPKRPTHGYSEVSRHQVTSNDVREPKPDTSYSVTRGGVKDNFDARTRPQAPNPLLLDDKTRPGAPNPLDLDDLDDNSTRPGAINPLDFDTTTPPPNAQPLARMTRPLAAQPPPTPAIPGKQTLFGVPPGPETATPPPVPKVPTSRGQPALRSPGEAGSTNPGMGTSSTTLPTMPAAPRPAKPWIDATTNTATSPSSTQPLAPIAPIAAPTAPTLIALAPDFAAEVDTANASAASTARGMGAASRGTTEQPLALQPPIATTTARGLAPLSQAPPIAAFQAPQTYPVAPVAPRASPVVLEVTPRGLGIGTVAGYCEELIRRNSRVPAETKKIFTTSRDSQNLVRIVICQGESRRLDNNIVIGDLVLQNLPPRPRGETAIEVTFMLDASGILQVRARDTQTNAEQRASLDLLGGVPSQDVAASRDRIQQLRR